MPAIDPSIVLLLTLSEGEAIAPLGGDSIFAPRSTASSNITGLLNTTGLPIICAWPVSGQYGFGTRILYYLLIAACVVARKLEWLRNACLAAALLFPVTAAIHGIVLAAVHTDFAVDMDIYGALQLCVIGVLVAPVSVMLSSTYNKSEGRNLIFAWSAIVLAGLISLAVEFFRSIPFDCMEHYNGTPLTNPGQFPYNDSSFTCGLVCDVTWPHSPIRLGSSNNIFVVPAPTALKFHSAMLIAAGACIPAILLPAAILRWNYKEKGTTAEALPETTDASSRETLHEWDSPGVEHIERVPETESASDSDRVAAEAQEESEAQANKSEANYQRMRDIFQKWPLGVIFVLVFVAMLGVGEWNLWSQQVYYQTDYMANVGQWAPLVGSGLAILGSGYLLLAQAMDVERRKMEKEESDKQRVESTHEAGDTTPDQQDRGLEQRKSSSGGKSWLTTTLTAMTTQTSIGDGDNGTGSRHLQLAARYLVKINNKLSQWGLTSVEKIRSSLDAAKDKYPETPGEPWRNANLHQIHTLNSSRRPSNESHRSDISFGGRQRSDTMMSGATQHGRGRSSSDIPPRMQRRRATLDVPAAPRSSPSPLPAHPPDAHLPSPNSPGNPEIVISTEPT